MSEEQGITRPSLRGFLSDHISKEALVSIKTEPETIYFEDARDALKLNFDFLVRGLSEEKLEIRFIKVAVYDATGDLLTFRHLNHNGVGTPGIHTIGRSSINGKETLDIFNPFFSFPKSYPIDHLRYMFTFRDKETKKEYYYGNIIVKPVHYRQQVKLTLPMKGLLTVLDGHDFYSHHRRFAMSVVRGFTRGKFASNFSRYGLDFTVVGPEGNTRELGTDGHKTNYDFHFDDVTKFYTHDAPVYAPADGMVVQSVGHLEDLYETPFNMGDAVERDSIEEIAGNYVVIRHNENEFSHLFHLLKDSVLVDNGEKVAQGQHIAQVGFSGASTTYSHLHYQLMDGQDFLTDNPLPCKFSGVKLVLGQEIQFFNELSIDTGDFILVDY